MYNIFLFLFLLLNIIIVVVVVIIISSFIGQDQDRILYMLQVKFKIIQKK